MATCPDCGEDIIARVCGRGTKPPTAEAIAAIDAVIVAAHKKMGGCTATPKETTSAT